jgi:hypothetical protein
MYPPVTLLLFGKEMLFSLPKEARSVYSEDLLLDNNIPPKIAPTARGTCSKGEGGLC